MEIASAPFAPRAATDADREPVFHMATRVVVTDQGPRAMEKLFDIVPPKLGVNNIQSLCRFGSSWLLFHHGSVLQVYERGQLVRESLVQGQLYHPNDCVPVGPHVLVCDGGERPALKLIDPMSSQILEELPIVIEGWRLASVTRDTDGAYVTVSAEDIEIDDRDRLLVSRFDGATRELVSSFTIPVDTRYSQGCTMVGPYLYLNNNNGASAQWARFVRVDLRDPRAVATFTIDRIPETEGLDTVWIDQRPSFVTSIREAVYLLAAS